MFNRKLFAPTLVAFIMIVQTAGTANKFDQPLMRQPAETDSSASMSHDGLVEVRIAESNDCWEKFCKCLAKTSNGCRAKCKDALKDDCDKGDLWNCRDAVTAKCNLGSSCDAKLWGDGLYACTGAKKVVEVAKDFGNSVSNVFRGGKGGKGFVMLKEKGGNEHQENETNEEEVEDGQSLDEGLSGKRSC